GYLTTGSFTVALRRFSAHRGAPRHIYSDKGTNFVGARRKLDEIRKLWLSLPTNEAVSNTYPNLQSLGTFIPPSSPLFWRYLIGNSIRQISSKEILGRNHINF
ncbi:hypothetical protein TNIN_448121, partial [Trichonephila inaurata madagascariensis]